MRGLEGLRVRLLSRLNLWAIAVLATRVEQVDKVGPYRARLKAMDIKKRRGESKA